MSAGSTRAGVAGVQPARRRGEPVVVLRCGTSCPSSKLAAVRRRDRRGRRRGPHRRVLLGRRRRDAAGFVRRADRAGDHDEASGGPVNTLTALAAEIPPAGSSARTRCRDPRRDARARGWPRAHPPRRAGPPVVEGPLPARPDRVVRRPGAATTASCSIRGCACTSASGARVATPMPQSLRITGTVAEWTSWTGLAFPESGSYVFPEGLAPSRSTSRPTAAPTGSRTCG